MREEMNRTHWTPGSLVKFDFIYGGCKLNNKLATYLGPEFIHRPDGVTIENHKVLLMGHIDATLIDKGLLRNMRVVSE
jgi:hypothetical protein